MTISGDAEECYNEMTDAQRSFMATEIINAGVDISKVGEMIKNGNFLMYVGNDVILRLFELNPGMFFDGNVWDEKYETVSAPPEMKAISKEQLVTRYKLCLEDVLTFLSMNISDSLFVKKTMCSIEYLEKKVISDVY